MTPRLSTVGPFSLLLTLTLNAACGGGTGTTADAGNPVDAGGSSDGGPDAGPPFAFQPSNIALSVIEAEIASAKPEDITDQCTFGTAPSSPFAGCFHSPINAVQQEDGSTVDLLVVSSLNIETIGGLTIGGSVPLVIVSLGNVTISGTINIKAGGATGASSNSVGIGLGGGAAGSDTAALGGSGGTYCGLGGAGGGQTTTATPQGNIGLRPLAGGSSGGGGAEGSGAGGGAIQIVAAGALTIAASGVINVGGFGGPFGGLASDQNAGGGGSGGAILLEGTTITVAGTLAANGGGGGGDYSSPDGADGSTNATPAPGGAGGNSEGAGGAGGAGATANGTAGGAGTGLNGGGGGGGAGRIVLNTLSAPATATGTLSPAVTTLCANLQTTRALTAGP